MPVRENSQTQLSRHKRDWLFCVIINECQVVVITEEYNVMGNNDVLTGTTEYLTL